jgi:EpsI family protein
LLQLPNITLEVADVCSGIASLFAMVALGTIYLHYLPVRARYKLLVFLGVFVLPIVANLFRIVLVTVSVYYYGPIMLQAFFHRFTGTFTFMLSVAMLLWVGETVRKRYPIMSDNVSIGSYAPRAQRNDGLPVHGYGQWAAILLTCVAVGIIGLLFLRSQLMGFTDRDLPTVQFNHSFDAIGLYRMKSGSQDPGYKDPHAEKALSAVYETARKNEVELFIGYLSRQFDENRLQSPKLVFPKGWEYTSLEAVRVPIDDAEGIDAAGLLTKNGSETKFVLFWYQVQGRSFSSDFRNRLELIRSWVLHGRTDGAVIRLATPVSDLENVADAKNRLILFSRALYPLLKTTLPR